MPNMQAAERLVIADDFLRAVRAQEWDRAERLWPELTGMLSDELGHAAAQLHMQRERWADAADVFDRIRNIDLPSKLHLTLCRNLASLRHHRPEIYQTIANADFGEAYRIHTLPNGQSTIAAVRENGKLTLLSGGNDPAQGAQGIIAQLKAPLDRGDALAMLSIGDGAVFDAITRNAPTLFLGRRAALFLFEPDPRLVLACMLIRDFTGENGPIEQKNVQWFVGPRWADAYRVAALTDKLQPFPQITLKLGLDAGPMEQTLQRVLTEIGRLDTQAQQEIARYYEALPADHYAQVLSDAPPRTPRVLLITTRFSTVLQYSTRDAADAFRQMGWEANVLIEPSPHHALTRCGMRRVIAEFKPDLIFQIDHNRFEHGDLIPRSIPFVNWIQDLLPHLMTPQAGRQLASRDFVLTPSLQRWVDEYAYPARQCLEFRKLTRIPERPISWTSTSTQVVYVSNWSQQPNQIREELLRGATGGSATVMAAACDRMIATYEAGGSLPTMGDCRRLLIEVMTGLQMHGDETLIRQTATKLFDRMNNLLFRQQGLRWAAAACEAAGLELQIYGNGWDNHPEFSNYARGPIGYGEDLETLTRSAAVNLVLEPFVCIAHQRLLDALAAGGFCLMRHNPASDAIEMMIGLLAEVDPAVASTEALRASLTSELQQQRLQETLDLCNAVDIAPGSVDHFANVRRLQRSGFLPTTPPLLPLIERVTFRDPGQLQTMLAEATRDENLRTSLARMQRQSVESRYSYVAGMRNLVAFLRERIGSETNQLDRAA